VLPHWQAEAQRDYRFVIEGDHRFSVFFADGGFFHRADIADGAARVSHDCAPDSYCGRYRFLDADRWSLTWRIIGPRKDLVISTLFSRTGRG
jgi:hypothetical protein